MRLIDADALKADHIVASTTSNTPCHLYVSMEQIANQPTASPWHRCKDELPPDGTIGRYLAYVFTDDAHWELHIVAWFRNKWLFNCGRVHYWMPIETPKEEE